MAALVLKFNPNRPRCVQTHVHGIRENATLLFQLFRRLERDNPAAADMVHNLIEKLLVTGKRTAPLVLLALLLVGCGSPCPTAPTTAASAPADWPTRIDVTATPARVAPGERARIRVDAIGSSGQPYPATVELRAHSGTLSASSVASGGAVEWVAGNADETIIGTVGVVQGAVTIAVIQPVAPNPGPTPLPDPCVYNAPFPALPQCDDK